MLKPFLCCALMAAASQGQTFGPLHTSGARPLNEALEEIEQNCHVRIFYEEFPQHDWTAFLRGGELTVDLSSLHCDAFLAAQAAVQAYAKQGLPGAYQVTVLGDGEAVAVLPLDSIFTRPITISPMRRNESEVLEAVLDALSAVIGTKVNYQPLPMSDEKKIPFEASGEPFLEVMLKVSQRHGPFACHLLYDPRSREYYIKRNWIAPPPAVPASIATPANDADQWFAPR